MALRPPLRTRRRRSNPFGRRLPDETIGLIAGILFASMLARLLALVLDMEDWTATWQVIDAATLWIIGPLGILGIGDEPVLIGALRPMDVLASAVLLLTALVLLASRSYRSRT